MLFPNRFSRFFLFLVAPLLLISGCGEDGVDRPGGNFAPRIVVFEADSDIVEPGAQVRITLDARDIEGHKLTVNWNAAGGDINGDAFGADWTAPERERKYQIEVKVSDGDKSTTSTIDIQVWRTRPGDYYPLAVGNVWRYRDDEGNAVIFEIVDTIQIHLQDSEPVRSYVLEKYSTDEDLEGISNFSYLGRQIDENGKFQGIVQHAQNVTSGGPDTILFVPFLPLYNFPLIPGNRWRTNFEARLTGELFPIGGGNDRFEVLSEETATVPAGTFEHVFQVQETFKWSIFEQDLDTTIVQKWLAPDVGIIKFTQSQTRAGVTVEVGFELESFELATDD
jgi:hypothetical protein